MNKNVKLIFASPLWLISNGIRYSHNNHHLSDTKVIKACPNCEQDVDIEYIDQSYKCHACGEVFSKLHKVTVFGKKDFELIKKVGFHMNHSSTLEHSLIVFDVKLSTKALLEWTRHRIGTAYTVTSSRYALDTMGVEFEMTGDEKIDNILIDYWHEIDALMHNKKYTKKDFDKIAMLLPQAFIYKMQVSFNLRSLVHFLELRTEKAAHKTIRKLAIEIIDELPDDYRNLIFENEKIKKNYEKYKENK